MSARLLGSCHQRGAAGALVCAASAIALAGAWSAPALAQSAPAADSGSTLTEVVVTAQRRSEIAQKVPIPVSVLSAAQAQSMGIQSTLDLTSMVPSLNISTQGPEMVSLRGISTTGTSVNQEQSVASYIDGVYLYGPYSDNFPLNGLDHTEVLYGPQGTLFGRNTTGGVIQYITRNPTKDAMEASVGYANYDTVTAQAYLSHKFSDDFAANLAIDYRDQGKGWGYSIDDPNEKILFNDYLSVQAKAIWQPTTTTKVTGLFWANYTGNSGLNNKLFNGEVGVNGVATELGRYEYQSNTPDNQKDHSYFGYIRVDQDLGFAKFVSITGARLDKDVFRLDQDTTPLTIVNSELDQPSQMFSQELQLQSPDASPIKWLGGLYYYRGIGEYDPIKLAGLAFGASPTSEIDFYQTQETDSYAVFGQTTFRVFDDNTHLTLGVRYTDETEYERSHFCYIGLGCSNNPAPVGPAVIAAFVPAGDSVANQSTDSSGWTGRVSLDHQFAKDFMAYVSYNHGLKSGGFTIVTDYDLPAYHPEQLDAYEIGFKSEAFDHRVRLNASAFYYNFDNIQVQTIVTGGVETANAAAATNYGLDLDFEAIPVKNLTLRAALGLLHTEYDSFANAGYYVLPGVVPPASVHGSGGTATPCVVGPVGATQCFFNAKGKELNYAPPITATVGGSYKIPTSIGDFILDGQVNYEDQQYTGPDNLYPIKAHTLTNASITWESLDAQYSVRLWSQNLFDVKYENDTLLETVGILFVPGDPQTFGVTLTGKF